MIRFIKKAEFKSMKWKNGQGTTSQILIFPEAATLEKNDFYFRISSAPILTTGEFSKFANCRRLLTPIEGKGFLLNGKAYENFEVADFSGDLLTHCELTKGSITDFGVIFDPEKIKVQYRILKIENSFELGIERSSKYFISVLRGQLSLQEIILEKLETLQIENEEKIVFTGLKATVLFFLKVDLK